ncbi:hypothetical protein ACFU0X_20615 [Streptomyces cellulosae]|uniref:Uncharacterized protein n=1 Tax=Streptomyces cellulosae TaxID=1968 RepID=A0ABW6JM75_STRCE
MTDRTPPPPADDVRATLARILHRTGDLIANAPLTAFDLTTQPPPSPVDRAVVQAVALLTEACHAYATGLRHSDHATDMARSHYAFASHTVQRGPLEHLTTCIAEATAPVKEAP